MKIIDAFYTPKDGMINVQTADGKKYSLQPTEIADILIERGVMCGTCEGERTIEIEVNGPDDIQTRKCPDCSL